MSSSYTLVIIAFFFFFNDTATTEIYTLSLHDAHPISQVQRDERIEDADRIVRPDLEHWVETAIVRDRKSTRLNSSHSQISYAVFCLKKKKTNNLTFPMQPHQHRDHAHSASPMRQVDNV